MEGIPSASKAMVVGQTADSTNRICRLVTIIILSSSSSLSSSLRKALRHHSLTLNFLASLLTPSTYLEFVLPTFIYLFIFFFLFFFSYEYLGQLLLFIYFAWKAQCNHVTLMALVSYGPVYNVHNSKLYLLFNCHRPALVRRFFSILPSPTHPDFIHPAVSVSSTLPHTLQSV